MARLTEYTSDDLVVYGTIDSHLTDEEKLKEIAQVLSDLSVDVEDDSEGLRIIGVVHNAAVAIVEPENGNEDPQYQILLGMRTSPSEDDEYLMMLIEEIERLLDEKGASDLIYVKEVKGGRFQHGDRETNGHP